VTFDAFAFFDHLLTEQIAYRNALVDAAHVSCRFRPSYGVAPPDHRKLERRRQ
jgi:hypothetical protein